MDINPATVGGLTAGWSVDAAEVPACGTTGHPVVADGRLFISGPDGVAAYDAATGAPLWRRSFPDSSTTDVRLAVVDGRLFMAANDCTSVSDPDGDLRVLGTASGAVRWHVHRDAPMEALVVDRDTVLVSGGDAAGDDTTAYRVTNGTVRWDRPDTLARHPVSGAGRVLLADLRTARSTAVDIVTGAELWSRPGFYDALAAGVTGGRFIARGPANQLVALNSATGGVQWTVPDAAGEVAVDSQRVYVAGPAFAFTVRSIVTGAVLWSRAFDASLGKPVVAGGVAYATVTGRYLVPLRAGDGASLADPPLCPGIVWHPVVVNGRLYATDGTRLTVFTP